MPKAAFTKSIVPQTPVRGEPQSDALLATEALRGERVTVYDINAEGWAWGQLLADGYVGWLAESALQLAGPQPTHKVTAPRTLVFPGPSIKLPPLEALPFGAQLIVVETKEQMAITPARGYVPAVHLAPVKQYERDFVAVAERFVGTPYLWGGKTVLGLDCSGLVQVALAACGIACPRDSDMQEEALGAKVTIASGLDDPRRGDLLFWKEPRRRGSGSQQPDTRQCVSHGGRDRTYCRGRRPHPRRRHRNFKHTAAARRERFLAAGR